jgi:lipopolysaccharide/colanic/teichoic acid biosynthesis glycosyltransferase
MIQDNWGKHSVVELYTSSEHEAIDALASFGSEAVIGLDASLWIIPAKPMNESLVYRFFKRIFDLVVAITALTIFSPIFLIIGLLIWFEDRGPVLFTQPRVGRFGVPIKFFKFRSMRINAEELREQLLAQSDAVGVAFKMKNDPRVTRIGKFIRKTSLDEFPQLLSVLTGEMSIVGPRPLPMKEGYRCGAPNAIRYMVKPGLICFREVSGRSKLTFDEWMRLDRKYVEERSLWLDLKIFMKLVPALLKSDGAY